MRDVQLQTSFKSEVKNEDISDSLGNNGGKPPEDSSLSSSKQPNLGRLGKLAEKDLSSGLSFNHSDFLTEEQSKLYSNHLKGRKPGTELASTLAQAVEKADDAALQQAVEESKLTFEQSKVKRFLQEVNNPSSSQSTWGKVDNDSPSETLDEETLGLIYGNNTLLRDEEATQVAMGKGNRMLEKAIETHGMKRVTNSGETDFQKNNCFLIALMQHATGDYASDHKSKVEEYRNRLATEEIEEINQPIFSVGEAAKKLVEYINQDCKPKLAVRVISNVRGQVHIDKLGDESPSARVVLIWDQGGHFEAIDACPDQEPARELTERP